MWREQQRHVINVHQKLKRWFKFGVVSSKLMVGSAEAEKSSLVEVPLIITWLYLQINIWIPLPYIYWEVISKPWGLDGWKHSAIQNKSVLQAHAYLTFWQYCFAERSFSPPWYLFWHIQKQYCLVSVFILPRKISQAGCLLISQAMWGKVGLNYFCPSFAALLCMPVQTRASAIFSFSPT